jgi:hypothetical protein
MKEIKTMENDYIKIYSGNFIIVQFLVERLKDVGISPVIKDESESGRLAGFGSSIQGFQELYVRPDQMDNALPVVQSALAEMKIS